MKTKLNEHTEIEVKALIDILINQTRELFKIDKFKDLIDEALRKDFIDGMEEIDKEIKPNINIVLPRNETRQLEGLYNYVEQNIQDAVDDVGTKLRQELQRGLQNNEYKRQIIARVRRVFKDDKSVVNRLKTVIRTETNRANNTGRLEAMNQA